MRVHRQVAKRLKSDLVQAGFVPNENKCHWEPSQTVEMLGMEVDMREGIIRVTKGRVEKLKTFVEKLSQVRISNCQTIGQAYGVFAIYVAGIGPRVQVEDEVILCTDYEP